MEFEKELSKAIEEAKDKSKSRKFVQAIDMVVNFTGVDFSKPDNRINIDVVLPKGRGKSVKVGIIASDELITEAKKHEAVIIRKEEIESLGKNKKKLKKIVKQCDYFLCQAELMPAVGKALGQVLAPQGKMPKPVPGNAKLEPIIKRHEKLVALRSKGKFLPTLHTIIGTEEMSAADLGENATEIINMLKTKLPNKEGNIKSIFMKTSMGPTIKVGLPWQKKKEEKK